VSVLADRLRGIVMPAARPVVAPSPRADDDPDDRGSRDAVADVLGGQWSEGDHRFLVIDRKYTPGYRHGRMTIADGLPPREGAWPRLPLLGGPNVAASFSSGRRMPLLFVDLETTGLAGGAGTYAFLVGCGWFDAGVFRIRQFFLSTFAAERALLQALAELAAEVDTLVTYNGKTFDVPLIETRYLFHRLTTPFAELPHVDMLHPARRLWRPAADGRPAGTEGDGAAGGCRLSTLEQTICGHVREGDVPGFEIPARYFHYVRSGDARPLAAVLEHNRLDLLSLALVTARAAQLLDEGAPAATTAREALGLGRLYERGQLASPARACFERAADMPTADVSVRAEALRAVAILYRRERRYEEAALAWRRILALRGSPPSIAREAAEALAVHHEHRLREPHVARGFALQSMRLQATRSRVQLLEHRLARLDRKIVATPASASASLFQ
jgi:uncharacterized protein YprB with RNaseH-like and TPR domain